MAEVILLGDGRGWYAPSIVAATLVDGCAKALPGGWDELREWLADRADQPNGLIGFDVRAFSEPHRSALLDAMRATATSYAREDFRAREILLRLTEMLEAVARGDPPSALNDLDRVFEFDGRMYGLRSGPAGSSS